MSTTLVASAVAEAPVTTPRKRNHEGEILSHSCDHIKNTVSSNSINATSRQGSPTPSDASSELTELTSTGLASPVVKGTRLDGTSDASTLTTVPAKKRKLTFAEREVEKAVKQREKEEKAKQKAEEKARKDEEKRQKDEEKEANKRVKELEKAEKQKIRDTEKQEKETERAKKEAEKKEKELEKLKKERSQLRIGSFFGRPAPQSTPPATPDDACSRTSSRRSSIVAVDMSEPILNHDIPAPANVEYEKYIIPYFVHENTEIAPANRFRAARRADIFEGRQSQYEVEIERPNVEPLRNRFGPPKKRLRLVEPVKTIAERIQSIQINTVALPGDYNPLSYVPYKILRFREDVRPPYIGTFTKPIEPRVARKLSRRPTCRGRTDTNYDYDSEAEWEEPAADDEEILEDEVSESEDGDEDMQDFLDDENDQGRRRMFAGEMEPKSSGLCFQGEDFNANGHDMESYRMDVLHDSTTFPIDPFSTAHWSDIGKPVQTNIHSDISTRSDGQSKSDTGPKSMLPPRVPLATVNVPNSLNTFLSPKATVVVSQNENAQATSKHRGRPPNPNKETKMIAPEFMESFKNAINGSDLTKAGLIEILKKQFPKCSKDAIKDTLGVVAVRVGKKEAEKKWTLV